MSNPNTAIYPGSIAADSDLLVAADNAQTTLSAALTSGATSLSVTSAAAFIVPCVVWIDGEAIILPSAAVSNVFSGVTRAAQGTAAAAHVSGSAVNGFISAWHHNQIAAEVKAMQAAGNNSGGFYNWYGIPLRGVSFSQSATVITGGTIQTLASNPGGSGKRYLVEIWVSNLSATVASSTWIGKSNGTLVLAQNTAVAQAANSYAAMTNYVSLEPGETMYLNCVTGSITAWCNVMIFDQASPLKCPTAWGGLNNGTTTLYTVPANTTAFFIRTNTYFFGFGNQSSLGVLQNLDTSTITWYMSAAGIAMMAPAVQVAPSGPLNTPAPQMMTAGQALTITISGATTGNTIFTSGLIWERPN